MTNTESILNMLVGFLQLKYLKLLILKIKKKLLKLLGDGNIAKRTKEHLEMQTGKRVISNNNNRIK